MQVSEQEPCLYFLSMSPALGLLQASRAVFQKYLQEAEGFNLQFGSSSWHLLSGRLEPRWGEAKSP